MPFHFSSKFTDNLSGYCLILISLLAVVGAVVYYVYALNWPGIILTVVIVGAIFSFFRRKLNTSETEENYAATVSPSVRKRDKILLSAYGLSYLISLLILIADASDRALISPWQVVNHSFFWFYALSSLVLVLILSRTELSSRLKIALLAAQYFLSFAVALLIYKIGYGYDPFIHQATMELIAAKGLVLPKPPYYLGEYSLIVIIHKLSGITIYFLNKILVPLLSALFLPSALYRFFRADPAAGNNSTAAKKNIFLAILFLLALTFSPLILTTPQNLSYLFLLLTVLSGLSGANLSLISLLALATVAIHPLTGLPALGWLGYLIFKKYQTRLNLSMQKISGAAIWLFTALLLPVALFWSSGHNWQNILNSWQPGTSLLKLFAGPSSAGSENWLLNFVYFGADNYPIFLIILIGAAIYYYYRRRPQILSGRAAALSGLLYINSALFVAYLLSSQLYFPDLITYEQTVFAERIPIIMVIFFLPFILDLLLALLQKIRYAAPAVQTLWLIFGLGMLTASLYLSYPRFDKYWNSHGYSTSANDIRAVQSIAQATRAPYFVLANQQVSAAALQEFGFDHYYPTAVGPLYFYPIPTGGPLYQYYLDMVYKNPTEANLSGAYDLTGLNQAYLIVNKYWYQSARVIGEAKLSADKWWTINNEVYIFSYKR